MCTIDTRGCVIFTTPPGHTKIIEYSWDHVNSQKIGQIRRRILRFSKSADKTSGCFLCSFFEFSRQYEKSAGQVWGDNPPKHNMRHVLHIFIFFKFFFYIKVFQRRVPLGLRCAELTTELAPIGNGLKWTADVDIIRKEEVDCKILSHLEIKISKTAFHKFFYPENTQFRFHIISDKYSARK